MLLRHTRRADPHDPPTHAQDRAGVNERTRQHALLSTRTLPT